MILVTGGSGLVGSFLLRKLVGLGHGPIRAIKRPHSNISALQDLADSIEWVDASLEDISSLQDALQGVTHVYHSAAHISLDNRDRDMLYKINCEGTANLVNASLANGVKRFLYVSSISAIGANPDLGVITEDSKWEKSILNTEYGVSKMLGEREVWRGMAEGMTCVTVNPGIILGPAKWETGAGRLWWHGGRGSRFYTDAINGYVDVRDVVEIMIRLMASDVNGERYILVAENARLKDLLTDVAIQLGKRPPSIEIPPYVLPVIARLESIKTFFTGKRPLVTLSSARMAQKAFRYSNQKIKDLLQYEFLPLSDTIAFVSEVYVRERKRV